MLALSPINPQFHTQSLDMPRAPLQGRQATSVSAPPSQGIAKGEPMPSVSERRMTPDRAAGNILLFIEKQLQADAAAGDSQAQLQSRLEAGLSGFLKGFNEAKQILEDSGLLSDDLMAEIGATYDKVLQGLANLADELDLDDSAIVAAQTPSSEPAINAPQSVDLALSELRGVTKASRSFDFTLTTQEGDKVEINASSFMKAKVHMGEGSYSAKLQQGNAFELTVQGDLNADELAAINDLLGQVNDLAAQFYDGDLDAAFQAALDLQFNPEEIASFAVDMKQTLVQKVSSTYGQQPSPVNQRLQPLGQMAEQVQAALESARQFMEPTALLSSLLERMGDALFEVPEGKQSDLHKLFGQVADGMLEKLA